MTAFLSWVFILSFSWFMAAILVPIETEEDS